MLLAPFLNSAGLRSILRRDDCEHSSIGTSARVIIDNAPVQALDRRPGLFSVRQSADRNCSAPDDRTRHTSTARPTLMACPHAAETRPAASRNNCDTNATWLPLFLFDTARRFSCMHGAHGCAGVFDATGRDSSVRPLTQRRCLSMCDIRHSEQAPIYSFRVPHLPGHHALTRPEPAPGCVASSGAGAGLPAPETRHNAARRCPL